MRTNIIATFFLACSLSLLHAQSVPAPLPTLRLSTYGEVHTMAVQGNGKIVIGGSFDAVNDVPRSNIARLNPDGSLDFSWAPQLNGPCHKVMIDGDYLYLAGNFSSINGEAYADLAKVSLINGAVDLGLSRNFFGSGNPSIRALAQNQTHIFAGGGNGSIVKIAKASGDVVPGWSPNKRGQPVEVLHAEGPWLFAGFGSEGIAKISTSMTAIEDTAFIPPAGINAVDLALDAGQLIVVPGFFHLQGEFSDQILPAKLSAANGAQDPGWATKVIDNHAAAPDSFFESEVRTVSIHNGWVYLGGTFSGIVGEPTSNSVVRVQLANPGLPDSAWSTSIDIGGGLQAEPFPVYDLLATDKGLLIGGAIGTIGGKSRLGMSRLDIDTGMLDPSLPVQVQAQGAEINAIAAQSDGKLLIGGDFLFVNGVERQNLARLNMDGTLDNGWSSNMEKPVTHLALSRETLFVGLDGAEALLEVDTGNGQKSVAFQLLADSPTGVQIGSLVANDDYVYFTHDGVSPFPSVKFSASGAQIGWKPLSSSGAGDQEFVLGVDGSDLFLHYLPDLNGTQFIRHYSEDGDGGLIWQKPFSQGAFPFSSVNDLKTDDNHVYICGNIGLIDNEEINGIARLSRSTGALDSSWIPILGNGPSPSALALTDTGAWIIRGGDLLFINNESGAVGDSLISNQSFQSIELQGNSGVFTTSFRLIPNSFAIDGFTGLSNGPATNLNDMAAIIRFLPDGTVQARDGDTYHAESLLNYNRWLPYLVTMQVDLTTRTYSAIVTPAGSPPVVIAQNYAFNFTQATANQLTHLSTVTRTGTQSIGNVNPLPNPAPTLLQPNVSGVFKALQPSSSGIYVGGDFQSINGIPTPDFGLISLAGAPVIGIGPNDRILIARNNDNAEEVTHFLISSITGGSLFLADGVTPVNEGDYITIEQGLMGLVWVPNTTGGTPQFLVRSALAKGTNAVGTAFAVVEPGSLSLLPLIYFEDLRKTDFEDVGGIEVEVRYSGSGPASVDIDVSRGSAIPVKYGPSPKGDYFDPGSHTLNFTEAGVQSIIIALWDDELVEGDEIFFATLSNPVGAMLANTSTARIRIIENDVFGGSEPGVSVEPDAQPTADGILEVNLSDDNNQGEWRLVGEVAWRASTDDGGDPAIGLSTGNYEIEFAPVDGYTAPARLTVPIVGTTAVPVQVDAGYAAVDLFDGGTGTLKINIGPDDIADAVSEDERGQWRRQGEPTWHNDGDEVAVDSGLQIVEFKTVDGRITPNTRTVLVQEDQTNSATVTYLVSSDIAGARETEPLVFAGDPRDLGEPYKFAGQIATEQGFGSGVVTQEHSVLTAAHVIFDDNELAYVDEVFWFFQRHKGDFDPPAMAPRGWYVFDGYADQRAIDVADPSYGPGIGSVDSQNDDAAVLYFLEPAGRNGFGGYQFSESTGNKWLSGNADKFLVGYPVEETAEADQGRMHATTMENDRYNVEEDFVWSTRDIQTNPGSSGGPVYVETTPGAYFPVAIYLGGSGDSTVRAIDDKVVNLMNLAETAGSGGGNSTGGGATYHSEGFTDDEFSRGFITVNIEGSDEGQWRVIDAGGTPLSDYMDSGELLEITPGDMLLELSDVSGLDTPEASTATVYDSQTTEKSMAYILTVEEWLTRELDDHGISSKNTILDDYDEDGLIHLLEYAFNLCPRDSDYSILEPDAGTSGLPYIGLTSDDPAKLRVEYIRRKAEVAPGVSYTVEFATDLNGTWDTFVGREEVTSIDATWERVVVEADETTDSEPHYFGRVRVTSE